MLGFVMGNGQQPGMMINKLQAGIFERIYKRPMAKIIDLQDYKNRKLAEKVCDAELAKWGFWSHWCPRIQGIRMLGHGVKCQCGKSEGG